MPLLKKLYNLVYGLETPLFIKLKTSVIKAAAADVLKRTKHLQGS